MELSELSTAKLIKEFKNNPTDLIYISELTVRLDNGELSDAELISLIGVLSTIKYGG